MACLLSWVHGSLRWEVELASSLVGSISALRQVHLRVPRHVALRWLLVVLVVACQRLPKDQGELEAEEQVAIP